MTVLLFAQKKQAGEKISLLTCYDYTSACLVNETAIDALLVGDTLAMTMHGFENTLSANVDMMVYHTAAVKRGAPDKFIIGDMPCLSYHGNIGDSVKTVLRLMQAGAQAIKMEGATVNNLALIRHLVDSGIPVMGHLGLTPQSISAFGGYKIQGKTDHAAQVLINDAKALEQAGCFALVLECVPKTLGKKITEALAIPTIGIGAGVHTDGQILVWQDMLGLNPKFKAKFIKNFIPGAELFTQAINQYLTEIQIGTFPSNEHSF